MKNLKDNKAWRLRLHQIIFEADTPKGRFFDIMLMLMIVLSVLAVMLDSVFEIHESFGKMLLIAEGVFTILFTIEYILRIIAVDKKWAYILSFYGIIDLLAILPTYLLLFSISTHYLIAIRILRLLRIFRVLKLARYVRASNYLAEAIRQSRAKIIVFLGTVMAIVIVAGSMMYMIEGPEHGFNSIPKSIYWAIVTITTVGYGDIAPETILGQFLASLLMITGYAIIAVPTGIISAEMSKITHSAKNTRKCKHCNSSNHDEDANYCKKCGEELKNPTNQFPF